MIKRRTIVLGILAVAGLTGCFRFTLSPESALARDHVRSLEKKGRVVEACEFVSKEHASSAETLLLSAKCIEPAETDTQRTSALEYYARAAMCGSDEARLKLASEKERPEPIYQVGDTSILLHDTSPAGCGLVREVTPIGWIVSPVALPVGVALYATYAALVVVQGIAQVIPH